MAIIPKPRLAGTVDTAPIGPQRVQANPEAFGAGIGRGLQSVGAELEQHAAEMQEREDVTRSSDAYVKLSDAWRQQSAELKTRQGLDAKDITKKADEALANLYSEYSKDLTPNQKQRLGAMYQQLRNGQLNSYATYEAAQMRGAHEAQMLAIADTAVSEALDTQSPEVIRRSLSNIDTAVREAMKGQSTEVVDRAILAKKTELHAGMVGSLQVSNPHAARRYLEANKDEIEGGVEMKLRKSLETATEAHDASAIAGEVWASVPTHSVPLMRERVYEMTTDPAIRKLAMSELKERELEADQQQKEEEDAAYKSLHTGLEEGHKLVDLKQSPLWEVMRPAQRNALSEASSSGVRATSTDFGAWYKLHQMSPTELQGVNLAEYTHLISRSDLQAFAKTQQDIASGKNVTGIFSKKELINNAAEGANLNDTRAAEFSLYVDQKVREKETILNRAATEAEVQEEIDTALEHIVMNRRFHFIGGIGSKYERDRFRVDAAEIGVPDGDLDDLIEYLTEKGVPVTKQNIRQAYEVFLNE